MLLVLAGLTGLSIVVQAQNQNGTIRGLVAGPTGEVVAGVKVATQTPPVRSGRRVVFITLDDATGPVDATFKAIEAVAESGATLQLYSVNAITQGTDSQGEVTVRLEKGGRIVNGNGADTDIVVASAKAYLNALNLMQVGAKAHPQVEGV